jgi:hypothetical protein
MSIRTVTNNLLDISSLFLIKFLMFAAISPSSPASLLSDLCELCVKKSRHPYVASAILSKIISRFPSNPHRMIFLAHTRHLTPIESYSSKKRGRGWGAVFSEASGCATRTNPRNLNRLIGLLHNFWIPGGRGSTSRRVSSSYFDFRISIFDFLKTASAMSPVHSSDEPSPHQSAATPASSLSARNTILPAGPRRQSASTADCASSPRLAKSSSPGLGAKISAQKSEKSKPAKANSTPPQNQSGKDPAAPASPSLGSKTTASRCEFLPSGYLAAQNQSSSSPVRPYIFSTCGKARYSSSACADSSEIHSESAQTFFLFHECYAGSASTTIDAQTAHAPDPSTQ